MGDEVAFPHEAVESADLQIRAEAQDLVDQSDDRQFADGPFAFEHFDGDARPDPETKSSARPLLIMRPSRGAGSGLKSLSRGTRSSDSSASPVSPIR